MARPELKILISDPLAGVAINKLRDAGLDITVQTGLAPEALLKIIPDYHVIAVRSATKVTREVVNAAKNLKLVVRAGVGLDNVDAAACKERGIEVKNTPNATSTSVAEHVMALMLALARHIPQANTSLKAGKWDRKSFEGIELLEKTLGIVGLGRIGVEVAKKGKAMGMKVLATDPQSSAQLVAQALDIEFRSFEDILTHADFITIHVPFNDETRNLFNQTTMGKMKKGAFLVNCARGGIVDEKVLMAMLDQGHIRGAAMDVFLEEPPKDNPIVKHPKVIAVPHLGASTTEGQGRAGVEVADIIIAYAKKMGAL